MSKQKKVSVTIGHAVEIERPLMSVLIRIGSKEYPQSFGMWWNVSWVDGERIIRGCCALGAAAIAIDIDSESQVAWLALKSALGWQTDPMVKYPDNAPIWDFNAPNRNNVNIFTAISSLNDTARWTREQIADWLQSIGY